MKKVLFMLIRGEKIFLNQTLGGKMLFALIMIMFIENRVNKSKFYFLMP